MRLFLTSSVHAVAGKVAKDIGPSAKGMTLAYIDTASEVEKGDKQWMLDDIAALEKAGFVLTQYTFTGKTAKQIEKDLSAFDALYMEGGNTFYLLQVMQQTGAYAVVQKLVRTGKLYIGTSAGSIIAGPDIEPLARLDKLEDAPHLRGYAGLGLVDVVIMPHWGSGEFRKKYRLHQLGENYTTKYKIILLSDNYYLDVHDKTYQIK